MNRNIVIVIAAACLGSAAPVLHAQHSFSATMEVESIDNPALSAVNPGRVNVLRVAPSYAYDLQGDRMRSRLSLAAVMERSTDNALVGSRTYPSLGYIWAYSWPNSMLELSASLAEAATRDSELEDLGRVTVESRERSVEAGARWTQELTARTQLALVLANTRLSYDSALLTGYRELEGSVRGSWEATERVSYYLESAYSRLSSSALTSSSEQSRWIVGLEGELGPQWSLATFAGRARLAGPPSSTDTLVGLRLGFEGSRLTYGIEWQRDVAVSAAAAAYVPVEGLTVRMGYRVTEGATLSASMTSSRSSGIEGAQGQTAMMSLQNELGPNWSSVLGVEGRRSRPSSTGVTAKGWAVRAGLIYAYPGR
jgi:hypothetical protein